MIAFVSFGLVTRYFLFILAMLLVVIIFYFMITSILLRSIIMVNEITSIGSNRPLIEKIK